MNQTTRPLTAAGARRAIRALSDPKRAKVSQWYFKTGAGEYGAGDVLVGLNAGQMRELGRHFRKLPLSEVDRLLRSRIHEHRSVALLILTDQFERGETADRARIYRFYKAHTQWVNNWDLVDLSAPRISGVWLRERDRCQLRRWAKSRSLWQRRIAVLSTYAFIRENDYRDTLELAEVLLGDPEDLIHKAVGWMLREIGNRDRKVLERFLDRHGAKMPRVMLRYAIERFPESRRKHYLKVTARPGRKSG